MDILKKYAPRSIDDLFVSKNYKAKLKEWVQNPKATLLIYGKTGVGKTTVAEMLAKTLGYKPVLITPENYNMLENLPKFNLRGEKLLPVIENLDEFPPSEQSKVYKVCTKRLCIITAKDLYALYNYNKFKQSFIVFNLYPPNKFFLQRLVLKVLHDYNMSMPKWLLESLTKNRFDVRSLLIDLQTFIDLNGDVEAFKRIYSARNYEMNVFEVMDKIFTSSNPILGQIALGELTVPFTEFLHHLAKNVWMSEGDIDDKIEALNSISLGLFYNSRSIYNNYATYGNARTFAGMIVSNFYTQGKLKKPEKLDISRFPINYRVHSGKLNKADNVLSRIVKNAMLPSSEKFTLIQLIKANKDNKEFIQSLKREYMLSDDDVSVIIEL